MLKDRAGKQIVIHNDFGNLLWQATGEDPAAALAEAARRESRSKADIISLCAVSTEGMCFYWPTRAGQNPRSGALFRQMQPLTSAGVDPFGLVVAGIRAGGGTVLGKMRTNDCHHVAGLPERASDFWTAHPEWRIGNIEARAGGAPALASHPRMSSNERSFLEQRRAHLLDYSMAEVRELRLALVREFVQRYDVDGLTLNFIREPYCVSFPSKNAHVLTGFVADCRKIVDDAAVKRGKPAGIVGAVVPWDLEFCRLMGLDVAAWIRGGLLDYVSPSDTWVTDFNMDVESWTRIAAGTRCAVYPGIVGLTSYENDMCIPEEYDTEGSRARSSMVTRENVRALAHGFYAEGADGVSFFNLYTTCYHPLFPLPEICLPQHIAGKERRYIYLKRAPLVSEWGFLQLSLPIGSTARKPVPCRLHEDLNAVDASVRLKVRHLADIGSLLVDVNNRLVSPEDLSLISHQGEGFLYVQFPLAQGMLRDGANEVGFSLAAGATAETGKIIIQELEIRVVHSVGRPRWPISNGTHTMPADCRATKGDCARRGKPSSPVSRCSRPITGTQTACDGRRKSWRRQSDISTDRRGQCPGLDAEIALSRSDAPTS